jgi:hypothetical protein
MCTQTEPSVRFVSDIFCPTYFDRHILSDRFCPTDFVRHILSDRFCPTDFVRQILSDMFLWIYICAKIWPNFAARENDTLYEYSFFCCATFWSCDPYFEMLLHRKNLKSSRLGRATKLFAWEIFLCKHCLNIFLLVYANGAKLVESLMIKCHYFLRVMGLCKRRAEHLKKT